MKISDVPFSVTEWEGVGQTEHKGIKGTSLWKTFEEGNIRARIVEYSPGFVSDHYCERGHVVLVLKGSLLLTMKKGDRFIIEEGCSFQLSDDASKPHSVSSEHGAKVFIVD